MTTDTQDVEALVASEAPEDGRSLTGEVCLGMPVVAWMAESRHGPQFNPQFATHWSTIPEHEKPERLFRENDVRTALRTLARERDEAKRAWTAYHVEYNLLEAQLAGVKEALEPFAEAATFYDPDEGDGKDIAWSHDFTIGSLRRARAVYEALASAPASNKEPAPMTKQPVTVRAYVDEYEFRGDEACHTPTENERAMIEDAIEGYLFEIGASAPASAGVNATSGAFWAERGKQAEARAERAEASLAGRDAEIAKAVAKAYEDAAKACERFAEVMLKCDRCGDVRDSWVPGDCAGAEAYKLTDEYKGSVWEDGGYAAMRFFEKHLCHPREVEHAELISNLATAIRARAQEPRS